MIFFVQLASIIEPVNFSNDSLIASLNGTLNIYNTKTSLTQAKNSLNQQKYICGTFNVVKLINELTEQIVSFVQKRGSLKNC